MEQQNLWWVENLSFLMGLEPTFLIGAFGLFKELSTKVGFAFSNNGWKCQDLRFGMKNVI
jgi:hypothetical protein